MLGGGECYVPGYSGKWKRRASLAVIHRPSLWCKPRFPRKEVSKNSPAHELPYCSKAGSVALARLRVLDLRPFRNCLFDRTDNNMVMAGFLDRDPVSRYYISTLTLYHIPWEVGPCLSTAWEKGQCHRHAPAPEPGVHASRES